MQCVFMRYELKYLIDREQKEAVLRAMREPMQPDRFGRTSIRNLYYDTPNYRLARRSIEAPCYKEKLRVRSYARVTDADDTVFVELKKKYQSVVYKRRLTLHKDTPEKEMIDKLRCHNGNLEIPFPDSRRSLNCKKIGSGKCFFPEPIFYEIDSACKS